MLDGLPPEAVDPTVTPTLCALAAEAGSTPSTGLGVLCAATYPNHASLVTGCPPGVHGLTANRIWAEGRFVPADEVGPAVPTLFDATGNAGLDSAAVLGDHHLVGVMGAGRASSCWPAEGGRPPSDVALDVFGYAEDEPVADRACRALEQPAALTVVQLNGPDTAGHRFGPGTPEARLAYQRTDAALARLVEAIRPLWERSVVIVLSDHGMEPAYAADRVELAPLLDRLGPGWQVHPEGSAALAVWTGEAEKAPPPVLRGAGVEGWAPVARDQWVLWGHRGASFAARGEVAAPPVGVHGSPRTQEQLVVVGGGDPVVASLAGRVGSCIVPVTWWARVIAQLLALPWPPSGALAAAPTATRAAVATVR